MKKRNTFIIVALLLAVVVLGVGYAASTGPWVVEGTATATGSELDVKFSAASGDGASLVEGNDTLAKMNVELSEIGDTATAEFTILNNSKEGIGAEIDTNDITVTYGAGKTAESEYFTVTEKSLNVTEIPSGETAILTITIRLDKVGLVDVTEPFEVSIAKVTAIEE